MRNEAKNNNDQPQENTLFKVSEIQLSYSHKYDISERPQIGSSRDAYDILKANWSDNIEFVEEFNVLLLNRSNRVLGMVNISKGGVSGTVVDAKLIFSAALLANASGIILCHNHPSSNLSPSNADIELTKKIKNASKFLDISTLDHLIITKASFYSFADEGIL